MGVVKVHEINISIPTYIMPLVAKSLLVFHSLKMSGVNILGFIDNDYEKYGHFYDDASIISPTDAFVENPDAQVILCEIKYYNDMEIQLKEIGFKRILCFHLLSYNNSLEDSYNEINRNAFKSLSKDGSKRLNWLYDYTKGLSWTSYINKLIETNPQPYRFIEAVDLNEIIVDKKNLLICVNATSNNDYIKQCLESIYSQSYKLFGVLVVSAKSKTSNFKEDVDLNNYSFEEILISNSSLKNYDIINYVKSMYSGLIEYDYIITIQSNDIFAKNAFSIIVDSINKNDAIILTGNEDRLYADEYIAPYYKEDYLYDSFINMEQLLRNLIIIKTSHVFVLYEHILHDKIIVITDILYHYRVLFGQQHENKIKPIALYLPQFHPIPENDEWWGKGFTEWTNVKRAYQMFPEHYQPHIPGEFGYYDLISDESIQKKQIEMAKKYGIYGFCYYYYWFNGKRLLEKPLNKVLENSELDFPFCICWANENWTRRWDGKESEILQEQVHNEFSDENFINDVIPFLKDSRYIKINDAPLLMIYRAELLPDIKKTISKWRKICADNGIMEIHISCMHSYLFHDPSGTGVDSVYEFPPHKFLEHIENIAIIDNVLPSFRGDLYNYQICAAKAMNNRKRAYMLFNGIMTGWDNTARRLNDSTIFINSSPNEYKKWLVATVDYVSRSPCDERLLFINAWNEWAEGAHLEPDVKYGDEYLQATLEAIGINT